MCVSVMRVGSLGAMAGRRVMCSITLRVFTLHDSCAAYDDDIAGRYNTRVLALLLATRVLTVLRYNSTRPSTMAESPVTVTDQDITIFREWLVKQPFLPQDVDDNYIKSFIIGAKGSIQKAKTVFDNFYKHAQLMPELFGDYDLFSERSEKFNKLVALGRIQTDDGRNLIVSKLLSTDATDYDVTEYFLRHFANVQIMLWDNAIGDDAQVEFLIDVTGGHMGHVKNLTPVLAEKLMSCVLNASPLRIKAIHLYNMPSLIEWAINIFLQLMPEKMKNRVHLHSNMESLHEKIPKKNLPKDYDGDLPEMTAIYEKQLARLKHYRERMMAQKSLREEEAKLRPKNAKDEMDGTFRKLAID